jgi:hypothetical protein
MAPIYQFKKHLKWDTYDFLFVLFSYGLIKPIHSCFPNFVMTLLGFPIFWPNHNKNRNGEPLIDVMKLSNQLGICGSQVWSNLWPWTNITITSIWVISLVSRCAFFVSRGTMIIIYIISNWRFFLKMNYLRDEGLAVDGCQDLHFV